MQNCNAAILCGLARRTAPRQIEKASLSYVSRAQMQLDRARHRLAVCQARVLPLDVRQAAEVGCRRWQVREPSDLVLRIEAQMRARHLSEEAVVVQVSLII